VLIAQFYSEESSRVLSGERADSPLLLRGKLKQGCLAESVLIALFCSEKERSFVLSRKSMNSVQSYIILCFRLIFIEIKF
jgi:hypothetical protein